MIFWNLINCFVFMLLFGVTLKIADQPIEYFCAFLYICASFCSLMISFCHYEETRK